MTASEPVPVISANQLSVRYRSSPRPQLNGASFTVSGGITALVGRNGAGKSTLIKALVGLVRHGGGELSILGTPIELSRVPADVLRRVGYLPQDFGFVSSFTTHEFVEYGAWLKKVPSRDAAEYAKSALASVGLAQQAQVKLGRLSGGMRRRAGIAQAIVHNPDLVILDEPTSGLDPEQRIRFRELIRQIGDGRTVVMTSHLIEDVKALASQVIVLESGCKVFDGTVHSLEQLGATGVTGDTALERGYISVIGQAE